MPCIFIFLALRRVLDLVDVRILDHFFEKGLTNQNARTPIFNRETRYCLLFDVCITTQLTSKLQIIPIPASLKADPKPA